MKKIDAIKQYFKDHPWTSPEGNELAIRKSDYTIIDVTLTEELAFEEGMKQAISRAKTGIEETLECERQTYDDGGEQDKNIQGWIEGLEYALRELQLVLEPEETPEPEPVAIIDADLQAYIDGVSLNILYSEYHKTTNGVWSRAEVLDYGTYLTQEMHKATIEREYWEVGVYYGRGDVDGSEKYNQTIYVLKDMDGKWNFQYDNPEEGK